ncbi:MAG: lipopolysaccharide biosynthesis protein [Planctomycetaceae bacterium]|nr:lipopolysaccharide biosynthesis protein [Planctomycetaceae bacterium]
MPEAIALLEQPPTGVRVRAGQGTSAEPAASRAPAVAGKQHPAPLSGWRRVARDTLYVGSATAIGHVLAAATSLLLRILLDPAEMGIWQGLKVVLSYANYTNLGTSKAAARDLAIARGKGNLELARRSTDLAFTFNTLSSIGYGVCILGVAAWIAISSAGPWRWAWCGGLTVVALLVVVQRHVTFQITLLRSLQSFATTSRISVLEGALTLAVAVTATWWWGLPGLYAGTLLVFVATWFCLRAAGAPRLGWCWSAGEVRQLIGVGGPMLLVGLLTSLFRSLDKLLILGLMDDGEFQLGCYSLAILATTQLTGVASMLSIVMGPRFAELLGRADDARLAARLAARTVELQALIMAGAGGAVILLAPPLFARLLPEYAAGLAALVWRTPGLVAFGLTLPISGYLVAVNQQGRALAALGIALGMAAVGSALALGWGGDLSGLALAMTVADLAQLVALAWLAFGQDFSARQWGRTAAMAALLLIPALGMALGSEAMFPGATCPWHITLAKCGFFLLVWSGSACAACFLGGWSQAWRRERTEW